MFLIILLWCESWALILRKERWLGIVRKGDAKEKIWVRWGRRKGLEKTA